jgi:HlyD family secretion protein
MKARNKHRNIYTLGLDLVMCLAALVLYSCKSQSQATPSPSATMVSDNQQAPPVEIYDSIHANGVLLPSREVELSFGTPGIVASVDVEIGDIVSAGQILARLDDSEAQMAASQAQADLAAAEAEYDLAQTSASAEITAARLGLIQAQQDLEALYENANQARAEAYKEIAEASKALEQASYWLYFYTPPPNLAGMDGLQAMDLARTRLERARVDFEPYINAPSGDATRNALKVKLDMAQGDYNSAARRIELEASDLAAQARLEQAQRDYENRQDGPDPAEIALAEARLANAQAQWAQAGGEIDAVGNDNAPGKLDLAKAHISAAKSQYELAQARLEQAAIRAPTQGVVSAIQIDPGEWAVPGAATVTLLDVSRWRVETKNVSELQIGRVEIGQEARVQVNAFRDETLRGRVIAIAPEAVVQQGDITYTLIIALDPCQLNLRPGMTAQVEILNE